MIESPVIPLTRSVENNFSIPDLSPSVVTNKLEIRTIKLRFNLIRLGLLLRYYKNPLKVLAAIKKLEALRKSILGDHSLVKFIKVDGAYYHTMNGPGIFSRAFGKYFLSEVERMERKGDRTQVLRTLLFGITKKCGYQCEHCYEWNNLNEKEVLSLEDISHIISRFQERGVGQIQFGGGEPMSRFGDVLTLLDRHSKYSDFTIVTSGFQLTLKKAEALKKHGLTSVTVSLDHVDPEKHDRFRGMQGAFQWAIRAVENCRNAGLVVNLSLCATREFISEENLYAYGELGRKLGVAFIWILEPHATGRFEGKDVSLNSKQVELLNRFFEELNFDPRYGDYPAAAYPAYHQRRLGCQGGGSRFLYIDTNGHIKACPMCGRSQGYAGDVDIDEAVSHMQRAGCGPFHFSEI